jgi:hypothetical protein
MGAPAIYSRRKDERLDSWKEIAAYLGRDLRTVRRWEKEKGLPVHRVPGGERQAVFAYRAEIDAWLSGRLTKIDGISPDDEPNRRAPGPDELIQMETPGLSTPRWLPLTEGNAPVKITATELPFSARLRFAIAAGVLAVFTVTLAAWLHRQNAVSQMPSPHDPHQILSTQGPESPPHVHSVSPILPQQDQTIAIRGGGFGMHTPYKDASIPFIAFRDKTAAWAAGRMIPQNWDEVTLNVESWQDSEIVISGLSGRYGSSGWKLTAGDDVEIAVWNPQTGSGPATYHLTVSPPPMK